AHDIVSEDSYQSVLQASPAAPLHAPQAQIPRPAAPPDAVQTLHIYIWYA
ncbi:hypothetical protein A2U01_0079411, partial [Trifolium medium]|nr:hypothetical protein [Trifolium medium]